MLSEILTRGEGRSMRLPRELKCKASKRAGFVIQFAWSPKDIQGGGDELLSRENNIIKKIFQNIYYNLLKLITRLLFTKTTPLLMVKNWERTTNQIPAAGQPKGAG